MTRTWQTISSFVAALGVALTLSAGSAHALATEHVGNEPVGPGWNFGDELLAAVNVSSRVYWYEVNGNPAFFFRGNARDLIDVIRKFAKIPADKREIILLPGPAETTTLMRDKRIPYDWTLHVPMGLRFTGDSDIDDNRATLTIHISTTRPPAISDRKQVERWLADIDGDDFKTREAARRNLEELGSAAIEALRDGVKTATTADGRDRIQRLISRLQNVELTTLELPKDVPVIGLEGLLERYRKELKHKDGSVRGRAILGLVHRCADLDEVLPVLNRFLKEEKHEYAIRCAASAVASLGPAAKPLVPAMRELTKSDDKNIVHAFERAIELVEKEMDKPIAKEDVEKRRKIRREIAEFVKARSDS